SLSDAEASLTLYQGDSQAGTLPVTVNAGGWVEIELSAAETSVLNWSRLCYSLDITLPNGDVLRPYVGEVMTVAPGAADPGQCAHAWAIAGERGPRGPMGPAFKVDATGPFADRGTYD